MVAARLHDWDADPVLEHFDLPAPSRGEVVVRLEAATVAHIDLTVASGRFAFKPELPWTPGAEGAGRVVACPSGRFAEGALVRIRGAGVGLNRDGTWAEVAVLPEKALTEVPGDVDPVLAATYFSPCVSAYAAVHELGEVQAGERVAVAGATGAVGTVAVQLALAAGAEVVALSRPESHGRVVPGARAVADVAELEDERVDVLIDTVGGEDLARRVTGAVAPGGRAVLVGYAAGTHATFDLPLLMAADVRLIPLNLIRAGSRLEAAAEELLARLDAGELHLPTTRLPLSEVAQAVRHVREGTAEGRVVVMMDGRA